MVLIELHYTEVEYTFRQQFNLPNVYRSQNAQIKESHNRIHGRYSIIKFLSYQYMTTPQFQMVMKHSRYIYKIHLQPLLFWMYINLIAKLNIHYYDVKRIQLLIGMLEMIKRHLFISNHFHIIHILLFLFEISFNG